ncbi:MAG: hypothetical protein HY562_01935, partial [Ignavibacteriales bacterium]|nr:hypothetical protein [Ignavibacteriales bacterium]
QSRGYYYPMYDYLIVRDMAYFPYPSYYINTRKELQPVFSGAYLTRLLPGVLPNFSAGVTYQAVFQDDKYYAIPQDIYRSVLGYDFAGTRASPEDLPIVDRYKGNDDIHHIAHMVAFFAAFELSEDIEVGAKLGRTTFQRDGSFGSQNLWDPYYNPNYKSMWGNLESRNQHYNDWDLSAGLRLHFNGHDEFGVVAGRLQGTADQGLIKTDTSFYGTGTLGVEPNWSYYMRSGLTDQTWDHRGQTTYGGIQLLRAISPSTTFNLVYGVNRQNVDIGLASLISDTSFNSYRYRYNDTLLSMSEGFSRLLDTRSGGGKRTGVVHRLFASLRWRPNDGTSVTVGFQYEFQNSETKTDETVFSLRQSQYTSSYWNYAYNWFDRTLEQKRLLWTFTSEVTTVQIPIVFEWRAGERFDAMIGVCRTMSGWDVNDVTLAIIDLRDRQNPNGNEVKQNFGERYTMPRERVSDVRTTGLIGFTARPSNLFNIRLLVTPNIVNDFEGSHVQDWRWWLAFQLTP